MSLPNLFPYPYRPGQEDIVRLVRDSVRNGHHIVMESGTGTGKTSVALVSALEAVTGTPNKIIFLTRTKSQQRQISMEAKAVSEKTELICVPMQGRGPSTCPLVQNNRELSGGTSEELSRLCEVLKKGNTDAGKCPYFEAITADKLESCVSFMRSISPDPEGFRDFCTVAGICPYETSKRLLQYADVVSAPYAFFFIPNIRQHFLEWLGIGEHNAVVIIDEAHNLPSYLRELDTYRVTSRSLELTMNEAEENGDPEVYEGITVKDVVTMMQDILYDAQTEFLVRENDMIPQGYLQEEMMGRLGMNTVDIRNMLISLLGVGEGIADAKRLKRKLPRSHILTLARAMISWTVCSDGPYVFLVSGGENPALEAYCLDPRDMALPLLECRSTVHMSGTLEPLPLYASELDLFEPEMKCFPSPFPKENLKVCYVQDVSTKYDELNDGGDTYDRLKDYVISLANSVDRSTAVFFPSYSLMERFISDNVPALLNREVYYERRDMPQSELMEQVTEFRCNEGSILFAVTGGRVSEGLDFPGRELELAIIVGIPYSRPSAKQDALIRYCQTRYGKGWDTAVKVPAVRKIRQAIGRLIRSEKDRGIAVILDRRVGTLEGIGAVPVKDPVAEVRSFFA